MAKIAILGSGSWATALVKTLEIENELFWWVKDQKSAQFIRKYHRNPDYLRAVELNIKSEHIFDDKAEAINLAEIILFVIPSLYLKESLKGLDKKIFQKKILISAIKGLIPGDNILVSDFFKKYYEIKEEQYVFLTGPSHAEEVIRRRSTYITLVTESRYNADVLSPLFTKDFLKIRTAKGVKGHEYASVMKNIYAIASGICHSLGYGDNFQAVLVSNAILEMNKFMKRACCDSKLILSSGYLGDLLVTSYSQYSRNRTFGNMIGHGYHPKAALLEMNMIPEGYFAVNSFYQIMKQSPVNLKIIRTVYRILYKGADATEEFKKLEKHLN